jgi:regulatory protein
LLARREHSLKELRQKLRARGFDSESINTVLDQLTREGLQSDQRYTESYLRSRISRGYGPVRIVMELRQRGITDDVIDNCIDSIDIDWLEALNTVRQKKFGFRLPGDYQQQAKESRFLQYRGFTSDQIRQLYTSDKR